MNVGLWVAYSERKLEDLTRLLDANPVVNEPFQKGNRLLHFACANDDETVVEYLLSRSDIDINVSNENGWTPLHFACRNGYLGVVLSLTKKGADVKIPTMEGSLPIHFASTKGNLEICKILIDIDPTTVQYTNNMGWTPLHFACCTNESTHIVDFLCSQHKDLIDINRAVHEIGESALHLACGNGILNTIQILLKCEGIEINLQDSQGRTPLHLAIGNSNTKSAELLLETATIDITKADNYGWTPLHFACRAGNLLITSKLLERLEETQQYPVSIDRGPEPFYINKVKVTPLLLAAKQKKLDFVKMMLPKAPLTLFEDNEFKEYLWGCIGMSRPLLRDSLRNNPHNERKLLLAIILQSNTLQCLLEELDVQIDSILPSVRRNPERYQRFLLQLLYGETSRRRFRVFFVGENKAGKSSLLAALSQRIIDIPVDVTTNAGLSFSRFSFLRVAYWKANDVDFILWNLRTTPNLDLFMETNIPAAYFILIDIALPLRYENITRLLNTIQAQKSRQNVFFIGTHIEQLDITLEEKETSLMRISKELSAIIRSWSLASEAHRDVDIIYPTSGLSFWPLDYSVPDDLAHLKQKLLSVGAKESRSLLMPLAYANLFAKSLQCNQAGKYSVAISWKLFENWGQFDGLYGEDLRDAALFFHHIGELVYFDCYPSIEQEYLIAHPIWLSTLLESMIELDASEMKKCWKDLGLPPEAIQFIQNRILENFNLIPCRQRFTGNMNEAHATIWFSKKQILPSLSPKHDSAVLFGLREYILPTAPSGLLLHLMAKLYRLVRSNKGLDLKRMLDTQWKGFIVSRAPNPLRVLVTLRDDNIGMTVQYLTICYYPLPSAVKTARDKLLLSQIIFTLHKAISSLSPCEIPVFIGNQCARSGSRSICEYNECMGHLARGNNEPIMNGMYVFDILPEVHKHSLTIPWEENKLVEKFLSMTQENGESIYRAQYQGESLLVSMRKIPKKICASTCSLQEYRKFIQQSILLEHKNLLRVYFTLIPSYDIVIEYFPCLSLHAILQKEENIPFDKMMNILSDVACAIIFLQSQNPPIHHGGISTRSIFVPSSPLPIPVYAKLAPCEFSPTELPNDCDLKSFALVLEEIIPKMDFPQHSPAYKHFRVLLSVLQKTDYSHLLRFQWIVKQFHIITDLHHDGRRSLSINKDLFEGFLKERNLSKIIRCLHDGYPLWCDSFDFTQEFGPLLLELVNENSSLVLRQIFECGCFHPNGLVSDTEGSEINLIHYATKVGSVECMEVLLFFSASPNSCSNLLETPLHIAVTTPSALPMSKLLLKYHANPWAENIYGSTPVMRACTLTSGCVPLFLSSRGSKESLNSVLLRSLILQYHKEEEIISEQIILLLAQGATILEEQLVGHEYLLPFIESFVKKILFTSQREVIPCQHLLWGLRSFFQTIPKDSFDRIQNDLVTTSVLSNWWRSRTDTFNKITLSSLHFTFPRANIKLGTVVYESAPIIIRNCCGVEVFVRFSSFQEKNHLVQIEPQCFSLPAKSSQNVVASVIRTQHENIEHTAIICVEDEFYSLQGYFLKIEIPL